MSAKTYLNFDLLLNDLGNKYQANVIDSPAGQAANVFELPFSPVELENFILKIGQNRGSVRSLHIESIDVPSIKKLGAALYDCVFKGEVAERFRSSLAIAWHQGKGLRVRLRLSGAPSLIDVPWELLFDQANNNFIGLSVNTPIIRKLDLASLPGMRQTQGILRVLVMISSPQGYYQLDVEREWDRINQATKRLQEQGRISLLRVEPSLVALQRQLRRNEFHVFHYIGHGGFDRTAGDGVLVLENSEGKAHLVSGEYLGTILHDAITIQLALLNSCSGGRTSVTDPFAGVGQSLLQRGIPAVIAMQFEITDEAAITFSSEFYEAVVDGYPIDAAVAEARKMIYAQANQLEWATPVLYTSIDSGTLLQKLSPAQIEEADRKAKEEADRKAKEEADRKAKEEADRKAKEEADRKAKEEADRKAKEEADRKAKEEADRKAKEEADRKAKEEADRKAKRNQEVKNKSQIKEAPDFILRSKFSSWLWGFDEQIYQDKQEIIDVPKTNEIPQQLAKEQGDKPLPLKKQQPVDVLFLKSVPEIIKFNNVKEEVGHKAQETAATWQAEETQGVENKLQIKEEPGFILRSKFSSWLWGFDEQEIITSPKANEIPQQQSENEQAIKPPSLKEQQPLNELFFKPRPKIAKFNLKINKYYLVIFFIIICGSVFIHLSKDSRKNSLDSGNVDTVESRNL